MRYSRTSWLRLGGANWCKLTSLSDAILEELVSWPQIPFDALSSCPGQNTPNHVLGKNFEGTLKLDPHPFHVRCCIVHHPVNHNKLEVPMSQGSQHMSTHDVGPLPWLLPSFNSTVVALFLSLLLTSSLDTSVLYGTQTQNIDHFTTV